MPATSLSILPPSPAVFGPAWHARWPFDGEILVGAVCCFCDRSIAIPQKSAHLTAACIYCGFDRGLTPEEEIEP
jgi:hypothetical protein